MTAKLIETPQQLEEVKIFWNDLTNKSGGTIFQYFEWYYTWITVEPKSDRLFIIVFYGHENEPIGIAPLRLDTNGTLRFIADTHADYSDFIIASKKIANLYEMAKSFYKIVMETDEIVSIELKNITLPNPFLEIFISRFDEKKSFYQSNGSSLMIIDASQTKELGECLGFLPGKKRKQLKRIISKNADLEISYLISSLDPFPEIEINDIVTAMKLHDMREKSFFPDSLKKVVKNMYETGNMLIQRIKHDNETVSIKFILFQSEQNHYYLWMTIYKNHPHINITSHIFFLDWLCKTKNCICTIDFCRGLYDYKINNFLPVIHTQHTFFYSKNAWLFFKYTFFQAIKMTIKNFYKKHKKTINTMLGRS